MVKRTRWVEREFDFGLPVGVFPCVVERLRGTPPRLEELTRGLTREALTAKNLVGAWSIQELKFDGEPKADKHNGMDHASVSGSGKVGGKEIHFSADILEAKKTLIVLTFGTADNLEKHAAEYMQLVKSIKKIG